MPIASVTAGAIIDPTAFGNAVADAINPTAWQFPTLINSWTDGGAPTTVAYRRINELVYLRGRLGGGTTGSSPFTLPAGFRPAVQYNAIVLGSSASVIGSIAITTAGVITIASSNTAEINLGILCWFTT